jgi:hypothetical protein
MELNFKMDSVNEYRYVKLRKWIVVLWGNAIILAGIFLNIIPRNLVLRVMNLATEKGIDIKMEYIDILMDYGNLFCIIGVALIFITVLFPYKKKIIVTKDTFSVITSRIEKVYHFEDIKKIVDYYSNGQREMKIRFKDKRGVLTIKRHRVVDYTSLFHDLKEKQKNFVLGSNFPENIESVSFPVSKHIKIEKGHLVVKDIKAAFSKIQGFTIIQEEDTYNMGMQIAVLGMKQKVIKIMPSDIQNDDALYGVLSMIAKENP